MFQSFVIDLHGTFLGAAVTDPAGFRFKSVHPRVREADGAAWPSLPELRRDVRSLYLAGAAAPRAARPPGAPSFAPGVPAPA